MKQIVMLQALCNNERGWARVMSRFGRVTLIQQGFGCVEHIEIWEADRCVFMGPERRVVRRFSFMGELTFGLSESLAALRHCWPAIKNQRTDVTIASVNALAFTAIFLRLIGRTRKVVCLVSDYFPPHGSLSVRIYRRIVAWLTRWLAKHADEVWAVSTRIPTVKVNPKNFLVPLCINNDNLPPEGREEVGYIGTPSADHALDLLFDVCRKHRLRLNVVGDSAYLESIKHLAPKDAIFHGLISDPDKIKNVLARCFCGYAVYRKAGPENYSYYGVPSKTLNYFANNIPVITTDTAEFTKNIARFGIGQVVEPKVEQIEAAVLEIKARFPAYYEAINRFRETWNAGVTDFHERRLTALLSET